MAKLTKAQTDYRAKFKDPRWQKKRLAILERDGFSCQLCGNTEDTLHVHHRYYVGNKDPWDYEEEALITLCEECHEVESKTIKDAEKALAKAFRSKFFAHDLLKFAKAVEGMELQHVTEVVTDALIKPFEINSLQRYLIDVHFSECKLICQAMKAKE